MASTIIPFSSLPLKEDGPRGNAWGLFGPNDQLGMLNRLTPETTIAASKEIIHGIRISTDCALDKPIWVNNGGIVGRGVLLDYHSWFQSQPQSQDTSLSPLETNTVTVSTLLSIASHQGTAFRPGDILLINFGYLSALNSLSAPSIQKYASAPPQTSIGLSLSLETLQWIWETGFSAVASDTPAFEALPFQSKEFWLHEWLIAGWGMPLGELFDLEDLARECGRLKKWTFFFSSMPLNVPGGVASPPNGVAIL